MSKDVTVARRWIEGITQGLIATVIFALVSGGTVIYLSLINSAWTIPVLRGLEAIALVSVSIFAIKGVRRLPAKRVIPNVNNIESRVRMWLDNFRVGVKNEPTPQTYFRVIATMDSGAKMIVGRVRDDGEYVRVRADMGPTADDLRALEPLTDAEKMRVVLQVRLELSRLGVGYSNLEEAQSQFYIFKRIPISENLTEDTFIANLDAVEAAVHAVNIVFHLAVQRSNAQELVGQPGSASYAPTPALPAASS